MSHTSEVTLRGTPSLGNPNPYNGPSHEPFALKGDTSLALKIASKSFILNGDAASSKVVCYAYVLEKMTWGKGQLVPHFMRSAEMGQTYRQASSIRL